MRSTVHCLALLLCAALTAGGGLTVAADPVELKVARPYLELMAGPGRGYPAVYAIEQGESVAVLKRKTDWYKVRAESGTTGWVSRERMMDGFAETGFAAPSMGEFASSRFEMGMMGGDLEGAASVSMYGAFNVTPNVALKVKGTKILGDFSDGWIASGDLVLSPFARWRVAPYFFLGAGMIHVEPQTTLVASTDRTDEMAHVGAGLRWYATRRFVVRAEYDSYQVFTSRNENEEINQWQVGFSAFF